MVGSTTVSLDDSSRPQSDSRLCKRARNGSLESTSGTPKPRQYVQKVMSCTECRQQKVRLQKRGSTTNRIIDFTILACPNPSHQREISHATLVHQPSLNPAYDHRIDQMRCHRRAFSGLFQLLTIEESMSNHSGLQKNSKERVCQERLREGRTLMAG